MNKKRVIMIIVVALIIVLSSPFLLKYIMEGRQAHFIEDTLGVNIKDFKVVKNIDNHGGFHGEGNHILVLDCSKNEDKALECTANWKKLPLSEELQLLMYGGEKDGTSYAYNFAKKENIPEIKNGYYYFYDRFANCDDPNDDSKVFRNSFNFSLALYDSDANRMYILEIDT